MLEFLELFRKAGKLRGNNWIDFSGGEPAMLKEFDKVLNYIPDHNLGTVVVYSNASLFSQTIHDALKERYAAIGKPLLFVHIFADAVARCAPLIVINDNAPR